MKAYNSVFDDPKKNELGISVWLPLVAIAKILLFEVVKNCLNI